LARSDCANGINAFASSIKRRTVGDEIAPRGASGVALGKRLSEERIAGALAQPAKSATTRHIAHDGHATRFVDIVNAKFILKTVQNAQSGIHHKAEMRQYFNCEGLATVSE
jgi:hypothetical protein